jgi:GPH family glycoside/pentoside/hexuronide:cation symporter
LSPRVDLRTKVLYGLGAVAFGVKDNGFSFFLLLYYNQVLGLPNAWVGVGIMTALMIDAVIDPVIGHLSDHLHACPSRSSTGSCGVLPRRRLRRRCSPTS